MAERVEEAFDLSPADAARLQALDAEQNLVAFSEHLRFLLDGDGEVP